MANWFQLVFQMQAKLSYSTRLVLFFFFCNEVANFEPNFEFESEFVSCILYLVSCILYPNVRQMLGQRRTEACHTFRSHKYLLMYVPRIRV